MLENGQLVDGKYRILKKIGQGGMSVVYLAMNEKAGKTWAIKEVRKDGTQDFNVVKQGLVAEIEMLKKFNHPNLPNIIDVIDESSSFLIVMDYIEGKDLGKHLAERGVLPQDEVIYYAKQLCDVLGYLHSRKPPIIYRDMKPANVMLRPVSNPSPDAPPYDAVLLDFGTAREFKERNVADTTCLGTRGYAAPEQYGGQGQTTPRTDIYTLGATMYHLITGMNPSMPPYEIKPIREINPLLSSGLEEIIIKCTKQNPDERYQNCAELMYALENYQSLDIESKRIREIKWKTFIASVVLCVVMAISSVSFRLLETNEESETYDSYIKSAQTLDDSSEAYKLFREAIELQPSNREAYDAMLNYATIDSKFTKSESAEITKTTSDDSFKQFEEDSPADYAEFCFNLATAYCFSYSETEEDSSGISTVGVKSSLPWFENALDGDYLKETNKEYFDMAEVMEQWAENTVGDKWGNSLDSMGNYTEGTSWRDCWNSYVTLVDMAPEDTMNATVALSIYKSFLVTINAKASNMTKDGVTLTEFENEMSILSQKLGDIPNKNGYLPDTHSAIISQLNALITDATTAMNNANNQVGTSADTAESEVAQ